MVKIDIDIECDDRDAAEDILRDIAQLIGCGEFGASCSKEMQFDYGGTVFVTDDDE